MAGTGSGEFTTVSAVIERLRALPALDGASDEVLAWLADRVDQVTFQPGEALVTEGSSERDCFFVLDGHVEVTADGKLRDTDGAGGLQGELGMLFERPRAATTMAVEPVVALRLKGSDFDELASTQPALAKDLATTILDYLRFRFGFEPPDQRWS
jgi:CRP-like cAMP-binding protein